MPETASADPKPTLDCTVALLMPTVLALNAQTTGGVVLAPNLVVAVNLRLTESLVLQSVGTLTLAAQIQLNPLAGDVVSVTMVAIGGDVIVAPGALIELANLARQGNTVRSRQPNASATATAGFNGGYIRILAPQGSIVIDGELRSGMGGEGGMADAIGTANSIAVAGQGGFGGDVFLCANRDIIVKSPITAGNGGYGGFARAKIGALVAGASSATGGAGNTGGSIFFVGTNPGVTAVTLSARVVAGQGGDGEDGDARGGTTTAFGGTAGSGGTVTFTNCHVVSHGIVQAGNGGEGGGATCISGTGVLGGFPAKAFGGNGGATGPAPSIPQPLGLPAEAGTVDGSGGQGGTAIATGGPHPLSAGAGTATGGTGAASGTAPMPVTATPTATSAGTQ